MTLKRDTVVRILELSQSGTPIRRIARNMGLSVKTVRKYVRAGVVPPADPQTQRRSKLDSGDLQRLGSLIACARGNASKVCREINSNPLYYGFHADFEISVRSVQRYLKSRPENFREPRAVRPFAANDLSWAAASGSAPSPL